jgi:hypothetical protein
MPVSRQSRNARGLFSGCGRYGYSNNGSGKWLDIEKIGVSQIPTNLKNLLTLLIDRTREKGEELILEYYRRGLINSNEFDIAVDSLPKKR